jgi:hypothetical protein
VGMAWGTAASGSGPWSPPFGGASAVSPARSATGGGVGPTAGADGAWQEIISAPNSTEPIRGVCRLHADILIPVLAWDVFLTD